MNSNYELIFEKQVDDLNSRALLLRHTKSGARVFILNNDDDNKVFYIGFRTPPEDSTGVAHIMEHSTLCGSEKFPLKDPFVELAKGSLNTFLNAMTFPDKTVYPVASCNDKDFRNLMDVYFDAVLHPNVYKYPQILKQEGWSYRIEDPDAPIEYNGVVYNEMKGAFSSPDDVLLRQTMNSLFPDTTYGVESGGDPKYIPDLTYEQFIDFHKKYYHPSNSYIYLYGNVDIDEQLEWMDREYLGKYDRIEVNSQIGIQEAFSEMRELECFYPITDDESEEESTYLAWNAVCGNVMDIKLSTALQMITYALIDTQGAPVRQRLLDEGIGKDILSTYDDGILQPYFSLVAKNAEPEQKEAFLKVIREEFEKAVNKGISRRSLKASLNMLKFKFREADFGGYPKGLIYGFAALNGWLYDDMMPLLSIELGRVFDELEAELDTDYFENVVKDIFLDNTHSSLIVMKPRKGLAAENEAETAAKLAAFKESLSDEEIADLIRQTQELKAYQEEPTSQEALETIPLLERSDIKRKPREVSNILTESAGLPVLVHDHSTNGIAYISLFFDCNKLDAKYLPYLGLLKSVVSFVDTENYTFSELNDEINLTSGGFGMDCGAYSKYHDASTSLIADLSMRVLYENIDKAFDLAEEVLFTGKYDDRKRFREIICELKSKLQMSLMTAGHIAASLRAASYYSENSAIKEQMNGIEFYKFVEDLEKNFDSRWQELSENIAELLKKILKPEGLLVSCTSDPKGVDIIKERLEGFRAKLDEFAGTSPDGKDAAQLADAFRDSRYELPGGAGSLKQLNEAFKTSGAVNYVARAGQYIDSFSEYNGAVNVFHTIMRFDYLWFNIRVQGGAYGCMNNSKADGGMIFVTYRDPNIARSNEVFEGVPEFLENFDCDEREMTKYVIGTMSGIDNPLTPVQKGLADFGSFLNRETPDERQKLRNQIIDCTQDDIRAMAENIRKALSSGNICCVGCESKIEEDKELFKTVRNLFE